MCNGALAGSNAHAAKKTRRDRRHSSNRSSSDLTEITSPVRNFQAKVTRQNKNARRSMWTGTKSSTTSPVMDEATYKANMKEIYSYSTMCAFSSLFFMAIVYMNNLVSLTAMLNLNPLVLKTSVLHFTLQDLYDEMSLCKSRMTKSKNDFQKVQNQIVEESYTRHTGSAKLRQLLGSIFLIKIVVSLLCIGVLYVSVKKKITITTVGTWMDFIKEIVFMITIAEMVQIWFPLVWFGMTYFPIKAVYIFWVDYSWKIKLYCSKRLASYEKPSLSSLRDLYLKKTKTTSLDKTKPHQSKKRN